MLVHLKFTSNPIKSQSTTIIIHRIHLDRPFQPILKMLEFEATSNIFAFKATAATREGELPQKIKRSTHVHVNK